MNILYRLFTNEVSLTTILVINIIMMSMYSSVTMREKTAKLTAGITSAFFIRSCCYAAGPTSLSVLQFVVGILTVFNLLFRILLFISYIMKHIEEYLKQPHSYQLLVAVLLISSFVFLQLIRRSGFSFIMKLKGG